MSTLTRTMFLWTFLALTYAVAGPDDGMTPTDAPLDGLRFQGTTGEQGKGDHHPDTISFKDGQFRSLDCENWGFGPAPYRASKDGDVYHFIATLLSDDRGRLEWQGTVRGDTAEASFRWLHERWYWTIDRQYWFKGERHAGP